MLRYMLFLCKISSILFFVHCNCSISLPATICLCTRYFISFNFMKCYHKVYVSTLPRNKQVLVLYTQELEVLSLLSSPINSVQLTYKLMFSATYIFTYQQQQTTKLVEIDCCEMVPRLATDINTNQQVENQQKKIVTKWYNHQPIQHVENIL